MVKVYQRKHFSFVYIFFVNIEIISSLEDIVGCAVQEKYSQTHIDYVYFSKNYNFLLTFIPFYKTQDDAIEVHQEKRH